jgi:hypothetical protein
MNCPKCNHPGKHINSQTIKGVLITTLEILKPGNPYYYCKTQDCVVVYFHEDGNQVITEDDLRVSVYHKHPSSPTVNICYCFGINVEELDNDIKNNAGEKSANRINAGIKAEQCACDIRNPEGVCCLGNVKRRIKASAFPS